jgi:hypothetical protein
MQEGIDGIVLKQMAHTGRFKEDPGSKDHLPPFDIVNPGRGDPHLND